MKPVKRDDDGNPVPHPLGAWKEDWQTDDSFKSWLRVSEDMVYCLYCRATGQHNVFSTGIPVSEQWDRTQLRQHCAAFCKKHQNAIDGYDDVAKSARFLKSSRRKKLDQIKASLAVAIRAAFWLCYECIAMAKLSSLYVFIRTLPGMSKMESVDEMGYINHVRCREFVMSLSSILKGYLWADLLASPFVSVLIDESTDVSTSENMIIYFIYLKAGVAVVTYAGMVHVPAVDAKAITETLLTYFQENGLPLSKVTGFCSDGASVMTGWKNGVAARLKKHNPFMQSIHCIAHRLALCCADAADDVDYPSGAEVTMNEISAYFNRSGKKTAALAELATEFELTQKKMVKSGKTRWHSRAKCVSVLYGLFQVLAELFATDAIGNEVVASIYNMLVSYTFVATLASMVGLLSLLATLSQSFQSDHTDYATVQQRLQQTRGAIISSYLQTKGKANAVRADFTEGQWDAEWDALLEEDNPNAVDKFHQPRAHTPPHTL